MKKKKDREREKAMCGFVKYFLSIFGYKGGKVVYRREKMKKGKKIKNLNEFVEALEENNFIFIRNKPYHIGWAMNLQLRYILREIKAGEVRKIIIGG